MKKYFRIILRKCLALLSIVVGIILMVFVCNKTLPYGLGPTYTILCSLFIIVGGCWELFLGKAFEPFIEKLEKEKEDW